MNNGGTMNRKQKRLRLKRLNAQQKQSMLRKRTKVINFLELLNTIFKQGKTMSENVENKEQVVYVLHYIDDSIGLDFECVTTDVDAYIKEYNEERGLSVDRTWFHIQETVVQNYDKEKS